MAIYYVPGEAGWNDNGTLGSAAQLRLKLETSYDAAANRSTLTVTMQGRAPNYGGRFQLLDNALVRLNDTTLLSGGGSGTGPLSYGVNFQNDSAWHDLSDGTGQSCRWTATVDHAADGRATATLSVTARLYYSDSYYMSFYGLSASQALDETRTFTLSISAGPGSAVTVLRNGTAISNGAALTYGDRLAVSFSAQSGYDLASHTLNGASFPSGGTHTVTGAVAVAATAVRKTYPLSISAGPGSTVTVLRGGTALSDGAVLTHGDTLTVRFAAQSGWELLTHTLNGTSFPSGGTLTVCSAVAVAATARRLGIVRLDTGSAIRRYRLLLDTGSAVVPVRIFLDRGDRISEAGI